MKNPYALILLVAATTAYGQINNPPTPSSIGLGATNAVTFGTLTAELLQVRVGTNLYVGLADDVSEFWTDVAVNETLSVSGSATFAPTSP
jgi:uncharacterized protein YaiE (UPF0345 family)